jgi:hypothetical protein
VERGEKKGRSCYYATVLCISCCFAHPCGVLAEVNGVVACAAREGVFLSVLLSVLPVNLSFSSLPLVVSSCPYLEVLPVTQSMVAAQATPAINSTAKTTETNNSTVLRFPFTWWGIEKGVNFRSVM